MNIAEILKYCPKGTKLYSTVFGEVTFDKIDIEEKYPIIVYKFDGMKTSFTEKGHYTEYLNSECVLFPSKDMRDWGRFRLPIKKGDIMMEIDGSYPFIATGEFTRNGYPKYICGINTENNLRMSNGGDWTKDFYIPASEEAKKELFDKMAEAGYKWNAGTLELEKIEPKFKEGDIIINDHSQICLVSEVTATRVKIIATLLTNNYLSISKYDVHCDINDITLASTANRNRLLSALVREGYKYDKKQHKLVKQELKPFEKVLVRDKDTNPWKADIYLDYEGENRCCRYKCARMNYVFCIPYEGNEYLLDTTDSLT